MRRGMQLLQALHPDRIVFHLGARSRGEALAALADTFERCDPRLRADDVELAMLGRERLSSTNLGQGVAVPHCRVARLGAPQLAIAVVDEGVDFEDGMEPVHIVFGLIGDEADLGNHLNMLVKVAKVLRKPMVRARIAMAETPLQVLDALAAGEDAPVWPVVEVCA
jgi:mannitol/fructose-specific phosphotransferase system IIA component (Ntr-type)